MANLTKPFQIVFRPLTVLLFGRNRSMAGVIIAGCVSFLFSIPNPYCTAD
jgi:hypothetical protein